MKKLILLSIMVFIALVSKANADFNYDGVLVLKDVGTNTPTGEENPRIIDDVLRMHTRLLEIAYHEKLLTSNGTVTTSDTYIIGSSSSNILVSFPSPSTCANGTTTKLFVVKNIGAGTMTLSPLIDGVGSPTVSTNQAMTIFTDGTRWFEVRAKNAGDADTLDGVDGASYARSGLNSDITELSAVSTLAATDSILTNATITNGTITNLSVTTGSVSSFYATNGTIAKLDSPIGTITTLFSDTAEIATLTATSATINSINIDNISSTAGTITGNLNVGSLSGIDYLTTWKAGDVTGTGSLRLVAGAGIAITGTVTNGIGTITVTGVGTTTAGGWLDTGTQSVSTPGYIVNLNGNTISGVTDGMIPDTITLDNITQITTRNLSDMQGMLSLGTQSNISDYAIDIQVGSSTIGTDSAFLDFSASDFVGTQFGDKSKLSLSTKFTKGYGQAFKTTSQTFTAGTWTVVNLNGGNNNLSGVSHSTSVNPQRVTVTNPGTYKITYFAQFGDASASTAQACVRLMKNGSSEIAGSYGYSEFTITVSNEAGGSIGKTVLATLAANDYVVMQAGVRNTATQLRYYTYGVPSPSVSQTASIVIERIDD